MKEKYLDTYFFDSNLALEIALQKNLVNTLNPRMQGLQICYYNGDKLLNAPSNCIYVPLENVFSYFSKTNKRFPKYVSFDNTTFSEEDKVVFNQKLSQTLNSSIDKNYILVSKYKEKIKKNKPDFSDKQLRVFIPACRETVVMQYIAKNIARSFKKLGYKVNYCIQKTSMDTCGALDGLKRLYDFNPHITININHFNNDYLHNDVLNFVWFQDLMPCLTDTNTLLIRKNDYLFALVDGLKEALQQKGVKRNKYDIQKFCIDTSTFKLRKKIKRKNKIIFIGSSYKSSFDNIPLKKEKKYQILYELLEIYMTDGPPSRKVKNELIDRYKVNKRTDIGHIINYIERDIIIREVIKLNLPLDFELYGYGWDEYEDLLPYYKGVLTYGKDISIIYNSAKYALVTGGYVIQQRTLEAAASGAIPVVLDVRHNDSLYKKKLDKYMIFFKRAKELSTLSKKPKEYIFDSLIKSHSYSGFTNKIVNIIKKKIYEK